MTLDQLPVGKRAKVLVVGGEGELRLRLLDMGITPGVAIEVRKIAPLGDPIELFIRGYALSIRIEDAKQIQVQGVE